MKWWHWVLIGIFVLAVILLGFIFPPKSASFCAGGCGEIRNLDVLKHFELEKSPILMMKYALYNNNLNKTNFVVDFKCVIIDNVGPCKGNYSRNITLEGRDYIEDKIELKVPFGTSTWQINVTVAGEPYENNEFIVERK